MAGQNKPSAPGAVAPETTQRPVPSQSISATQPIGRIDDTLSAPQRSVRDTVPLPTTLLRIDADRAMVPGGSPADDEALRETVRIQPGDITGRTRSGTHDVTLGDVPRGEFSGIEVQKEAEGLSKYPVSYSLISIPNPEGGSVDLSSLDEALAQELRRFASDLQIVSREPRVYGLVIRGERSVSRTVEVYTMISRFANELGLQQPSIVASSAKLSVKQTAGMNTIPESLLRHKDVILNNNGMQAFDRAFSKACQDPREASYVNIRAKHMLTDDLILASSFESRLKLIPGGSKHQYFRDREMGQTFDILDRGLTSGRPQFITLEAALQMGKSRMIFELTAKLRAQHPTMREIFVPQKDHDANSNLSYVRAFAKVLLETTKDVLTFNASKEYEYLAQFVEGSKRPVEINGLIKALTGYFANTQSSGISLFVTPDDLHWIDPASVSIIGQVFSRKNYDSLVGVVGAFAGRNGDQPIPNALLNSLGVKNEERIFLDKIDLLDKHGNPVPEFKKFVLDLLGYDVTKPETMHVVLHDDVLLKLASLAHGNPGKLTGTVNAMKEGGVLKRSAHKVIVDTKGLMEWEDTGLAASAMVNKVDRHIEDPQKRAVLAYIVALSHIGGCTLALLYEFFEHGIKKPEYYDMALNLVSEEVLARSGDREEKISIMEKDFADLFSQRMPAAEMKETYAHALVYLHKMREHFKGQVVLPQASAYNLYKCAEKADMVPYKKHYSLAAFEEAAQRRDYQVVLDIYDYVKSDRGLLRTIEDKNAFYLHVLEAMQVVGGERYFGSKNGEASHTGEFELLAAQVRGGFESGFMQEGDLVSFEKFCDTIIAGYFRRSILQGLSEDSAKKIAEWSHYYSQCFQNYDAYMHQQGGELDPQEKRMLEFKCLYNDHLSRLAFHASKEAGSHFESLVMGMEQILSSGEDDMLQNDPRFQIMYVQSLRLLGVAYLNLGGSDVMELSTKYGTHGHVMSSFDDAFDLQQCAATSPESHAYRSYIQAFTQLEKFFAFLKDHPNVAIDDSTYNRGLQNVARASTWTGNYDRAWKYFSDMRTRANNSGDVTGFAAATKDASIMIAYLVRNLEQFSPKQHAELWNQAQELLKNLDLEYTGKSKTYTPAELTKGLLEYGRSFASKSVGVLRSRDTMGFQIVLANQIDLDLMKREQSLKIGEKSPEIFHHAYSGMDDVDALMTTSWGASFYAIPILARYSIALLEDMDRVGMPEEGRDQIYMFIDKVLHQYKNIEREIDGKVQQIPSVVGRNPALLKALADIQQELYKMNRDSMPEYVRLLKSKFDAVRQLLEAHMNSEERAVLQS